MFVQYPQFARSSRIRCAVSYASPHEGQTTAPKPVSVIEEPL